MEGGWAARVREVSRPGLFWGRRDGWSQLRPQRHGARASTARGGEERCKGITSRGHGWQGCRLAGRLGGGGRGRWGAECRMLGQEIKSIGLGEMGRQQKVAVSLHHGGIDSSSVFHSGAPNGAHAQGVDGGGKNGGALGHALRGRGGILPRGVSGRKRLGGRGPEAAEQEVARPGRRRRRCRCWGRCAINLQISQKPGAVGNQDRSRQEGRATGLTSLVLTPDALLSLDADRLELEDTCRGFGALRPASPSAAAGAKGGTCRHHRRQGRQALGASGTRDPFPRGVQAGGGHSEKATTTGGSRLLLMLRRLRCTPLVSTPPLPRSCPRTAVPEDRRSAPGGSRKNN